MNTPDCPPRDFAAIDLDLCRARARVWETASGSRWNTAIEQARRIEALAGELTACLEARAVRAKALP